jgi:hypothetical protein
MRDKPELGVNYLGAALALFGCPAFGSLRKF